MRARSLLLPVAALALASCANEASKHISKLEQRLNKAAEAVASATADCGVVLTPGSTISYDAKSIYRAPVCDTERDTRGNRARVLELGGKIDPFAYPGQSTDDNEMADWAGRMFLLTVSYGSDVRSSNLPPFTWSELREFNATIITKEASVDTGAGPIHYAVWSMQEPDTKISYSCVVTERETTMSTPLRIAICRSVVKLASKNQVMKRAERIAKEDLPNVNATGR